MARAKKETALTPEERLQATLVPDWEWPYKLPENWCWVYAPHIFDIEYGKGLPTKQLSDTGYPVFGANGQIGFYSEYMYKEPQALMSCRGAYSGTMNKSLPYSYVTSNSLIISSPRGLMSTDCIYYLFSALNVSELISGTAQPQVTVQAFDGFPIPLSPLAEQQRIVDRIESLFAKLDEAKEKAQAVVDSFETRKAAILHKAFTGELTAKWREEHYATDNTVLMDIKNYSSSWSAKEKDLLSREQAKSEVVVLDNGHEWIRCTIGAVGRVTNGSTPLRKEPKYWSGKIPWISSGEVRNNIIESSNECISEEGYANSSVKLLPIGTVLIAMIGEGKTRGQSAILDIEATINQNVAAIVVEHNCVLPYYIWYWLQMNYAKNREKGSGSGPQALNCQRVRELDFFVPNLKEQKEVVNILRKALAKEQQSKEAAEAVLDQINLMKKSILARAFRGEMGTNDPSEESAVELLKEIIRRG